MNLFIDHTLSVPHPISYPLSHLVSSDPVRCDLTGTFYGVCFSLCATALASSRIHKSMDELFLKVFKNISFLNCIEKTSSYSSLNFNKCSNTNLLHFGNDWVVPLLLELMEEEGCRVYANEWIFYKYNDMMGKTEWKISTIFIEYSEFVFIHF